MTAGLAEQAGVFELVGPKGYVHGWHFVGIPAAGTKITLPRGRRGTVIGGDHQHARVRTASGDTYHIPHDKKPGPARLVKDAGKPEPKPVPELTPRRQKLKREADAAIARGGEVLFHGTPRELHVGDVIDAKHAKPQVTQLHEGIAYAFASTDAGEATFAGKAGSSGHVYRVEPVDKYEFDTHQGSATSRRTTSGFRVVEEVKLWSGEPLPLTREQFLKLTKPQQRAYLRTGKRPAGISLSIAEQAGVIDLVGSPAWLHELRVPKGSPHAGEWVHAPGDKPGKGLDRYVVPPHSRLLNPRADHTDPADYPFFRKHPVSVQNIIDAYDATPKEMRQDGMDWYWCAHLLAQAMGHGNAEEASILLGNYSTSANWPINMFRAAKVAHDRVPIPKGQGYVNADQVRKAQKALDGLPIDEVLVSPKTRSFAHLLTHGDDLPDDPYGHVVIDAHALNVAAGGNLRGATYARGKKQRALAPEDDAGKVLQDARAHEYVGDMYREAASIISHRDGVLIKPHQMQAVTWVAQVLANQAEDKAVMEGGATGGVLGRAKGRIANEVKDWKTWLAYAKAQQLPLVPGVSALAAQILAAQIIELVGGDSITAQLDLFNPQEPRAPDGRWVRGVGGLAETLAERETEYRQRRAARNLRRARGQYEYPHITAEHARGNSRPVSAAEFQRLAKLGNAWIDRAKRDASPATGLDAHWDQIKHDAYAEARKPWGGATINTHTGEQIRHDADLYALSVKPRGMVTVTVPEDASEAEFGAAMDRARELFRPALERKHFHLGVFHDDENHRIDIDPVAIVDSVDLVEQVGAYTRAIGGAYHFRTGDGVWPPHVAEGMNMADDGDQVHWEGIGQWHSQAVEIQDPEPDDEPED